jgi:hypothetical protein
MSSFGFCYSDDEGDAYIPNGFHPLTYEQKEGPEILWF